MVFLANFISLALIVNKEFLELFCCYKVLKIFLDFHSEKFPYFKIPLLQLQLKVHQSTIFKEQLKTLVIYAKQLYSERFEASCITIYKGESMVSPALGIQRKIDKIAGMAALTAKWCHQGDQEV